MSKPSLSALKKAHKTRKPQRDSFELPKEVRVAWIQKFATHLLDSMDPVAAYRTIRSANQTPVVNRPGSMGGFAALIHRLTKDPDVDAELRLQIEELKKYAGIDKEWIFRKWKAMGESNIFDYLVFDKKGKLKEVKLDPANLSFEQQQCVREVKFDPKSGKLVGLKLISLEGTVENIAKRIFKDAQEEEAITNRVAEVTRMVQEARKRVRVWDNESGEQIS